MPNQRFGVDAGRDLTIFMGTEDEPSTLRLAYDEARRLAIWLRQEIAYRFEGEEHAGTINVADVPCDYDDALELLLMLDLGLGPEEELDDRESPKDGDDLVDWRKEGF